MDLIPQFKKTAGVQKMHTVFLTDGASNNINSNPNNSSINNINSIIKEHINDMIIKKISKFLKKTGHKYNYFNKLERYALLRGRNWKNSERDEYFSYREKMDLNDSDLSLFEPYITYLMNYFNEKNFR